MSVSKSIPRRRAHDEAIYPAYSVEADAKPMDASVNRYTLRFAPGKSPPAKAFWSVTMHDAKDKLLVPNALNRYLVNSPMLPHLKRDTDGGLTLYLQSESSGKDKESSWLPAPKGPFVAFMRLH